MPGLGRRQADDPRDLRFPMRAAHSFLGVDEAPVPSTRFHRPGIILDQGETGTCVAHAWEGVYLGRPKERKPDPALSPFAAYRRIVLMDEWSDNDNEATAPDADLQGGTSVRAGAKLYAQIGRIVGSYVWASGIEDGIRHVGLVGPVVLGVNWYDSFFDPDPEGIIRLPPTARLAGGHAIKWVGIDLNRGLAVLQNSWGRSWGGWTYQGRRVHPGECRVPFQVIERLLSEDGEGCAAVEPDLRRGP